MYYVKVAIHTDSLPEMEMIFKFQCKTCKRVLAFQRKYHGKMVYVKANSDCPGCDETKKAAKVLVCTRWMKAAKYCPTNLLSHLQPSLYEKECETIIQVKVNVAWELSVL